MAQQFSIHVLLVPGPEFESRTTLIHCYMSFVDFGALMWNPTVS